jgi:DNA modification methylase
MGITWTNEQRRLGDLLPWPRNPRQIKDRQAARLAESVDTFGQVETLAIGPDNAIYNGHQRLNVLRGSHGADFVVDVRVSSRPLTEKEREKLTVFLHRGATGEWNFDTLANEFELDELIEWGFEPFELGLSDDYGKPVIEDPGAQLSKADELQQKWNVAPGDLWELDSGNGYAHRLICGDCTDAATVAMVMGGERAALCVTSPPYWVGKEYERETGFDQVRRHIEASCGAIAGALALRSHVAINTGATTETALGGERRVVRLLLDWWQEAFEPFGYYMRNVRIWAKQGRWTPYSPTQDVVDLNWEFLASFVTDKLIHQNKIGESWALEGVWTIQPQTENVNHSAPFPVELPSRYISLYTNAKDYVYEPYLGSGTTLMGCEQLGRRCRAVEIAPSYCAVALERWSVATGKEPVLISNTDA